MAAHGQHHITPLKTFLKVYASLIALTIFTVYTATQWNLGWFNTPLAMIIATTKAAIVALWFMHLKYDTKLNRVVFLSAFFFLMLFFGLTAMDLFTRDNFHDTSVEELRAKVEASANSSGETQDVQKAEEPAQGSSGQ
jgi:caa(3)-type oxidase subunit IV